MIILGFFVLGLFLAIFQTTVLMANPVWSWSPDLYYILLAYLAYRMDLMRSLIILFPLSCFLDVLSGTILGIYPVFCLGGFSLLRVMAVKLPVRESLYQVPLIGVSYLAVSWIIHVVLAFLLPNSLVTWSWPAMFARAVMIVALAFPMFRFFVFFNKRLQKGFHPLRKLTLRSGNRYR